MAEWKTRYQDHDLPVTPLRPSAGPDDKAESLSILPDAVSLLSALIACGRLSYVAVLRPALPARFAYDRPSQLSLPDLSTTSISIIINPALGLPILQSLFPTQSGPSHKEPTAVWFQPGAESLEIAEYVKTRGIEGKVVYGGPCILVLGERLMNEHRRQGKGKM